MPKSDIATISPVLLIISLILPAALGSRVSAQPMEMMLLSVPLKLAGNALMWFMLQYTAGSYVGHEDGPHISFMAPLMVRIDVSMSQLVLGD